MDLGTIVLVILLVLAVFIVFIALTSIRIVPQWAKLVVYRWGRTGSDRVKDPGFRFLVPIAERGVVVDLREQFTEVERQTTITRDNAPIAVDFLIFWRIVDALMSQVNAKDFNGLLQGVAATSLRSVIGDIPLDDVLSKREQINETLRLKLDEVTERWGGKVTMVEIREIMPPPAVQEAMNRQLSAERTRRAVITESEGARQATINVAEGDKQSNILRAEGERQAAILRAQGFSQALQTIFAAAHDIDQKTMTLQYLEALKALGAGPATKFVIPLEFSQLVAPIGRFVEQGMQSASPGASPAAASEAIPAPVVPPPPPVAG